MNTTRRGPIAALGGHASDSHIHLDPVILDQGSTSPRVATAFLACDRALALLGELGQNQAGLPRAASLAWERAAFSEIFDHPEPGRRIRSFLEKG